MSDDNTDQRIAELYEARYRAERSLADEWHDVATGLYAAIGELERNQPGGFTGRLGDAIQPAIDAYEYADDRYRETRQQ